jgi:hypothetical protein
MRVFLSRHLFTLPQGMTLGGWRELLRENHYQVDVPYLPKAMFVTTSALANSAQAAIEQAVYGRRIDATQVEPPLFILGHYRSGTTHLHNLLALDHRFAYPNTYQAVYPHTFLTTERVVSPLASVLMTRTRPQDDMAMRLDLPAEDEFALCNATGLSPYVGWLFPRRGDFYARYLTFDSVAKELVTRWENALRRFVKKLTWKYGRPLVLKSPPHTARIRLLLGVFPGAKFVHIYRNPYTVFRSERHTWKTGPPLMCLQRPEFPDAEDQIIANYRAMHDAYFGQRGLIPAGHLHELAFEELERDPIGQLEAVYDSLGLGALAAVRPRVEGYLASIAGYRKTAHAELSEPLRSRIAQEWRRSFEEWGYPVRPRS